MTLFSRDPGYRAGKSEVEKHYASVQDRVTDLSKQARNEAGNGQHRGNVNRGHEGTDRSRGGN